MIVECLWSASKSFSSETVQRPLQSNVTYEDVADIAPPTQIKEQRKEKPAEQIARLIWISVIYRWAGPWRAPRDGHHSGSLSIRQEHNGTKRAASISASCALKAPSYTRTKRNDRSCEGVGIAIGAFHHSFRWQTQYTAAGLPAKATATNFYVSIRISI